VVALLVGAGSARAQQDAGVAVPPPASVGMDAGQIVIPDHMMPQPDAPEVRAAVAQSSVELGRRFSLFVTIVRPPGVDVNIPAALPLGGSFEEVRRTFHDDTRADGMRVREYELQLMPWVVGDMVLAPIDVTYVIDGTARVTQTAPVAIEVTGVIGAGDGSLRDVAPPVEVTRRDWTRLWLAGGGLGILLLGLLLWWSGAFRRRRGGRGRAAARREPEVALTPQAEALRRLELLARGEAMAAEDRKPLYVEMSEIVRAYLGHRFEFPALDRASSEIRAHIGSRPDGEPAGRLVDRWLTEVDLVKYAGMRATADDAGAAITLARELVETCERTPVERARPPEPVMPPAPVIPMLQPEAAPEAEPDAGDTLRGIGAAAAPTADEAEAPESEGDDA